MLPPSENQSAVAKNVQSTSKTTIYTNTNSVYLSSKRLLDFLAAFIGIILLSPFLLLTAICIKVEDSKGPVLFKQERVGKNGKTFFMYKFRSMVSNAEELKKQLLAHNEVDGPVFKIKEDPRVTKVGKFIRRTSIDELPQLINVLKGEMSLVGPRPALPEEVDQYSVYERQRLKVLPGLTCYWQISGRSNISFYEWMELDIKYIRERNFWLDLKLIFKTVLVLFGSKDAY
ncbi:sugar transferase [Paraliobacillus ryukyuensis]|uniref:sugar transferase n=1 Tax=Paraliobacillus ryukyuensis TaxID=200904 RepID=UPI0009A761BB|nr:sugar transferase [Paraliobacillus ryukyuensis]